jgi:hypothetical protein
MSQRLTGPPSPILLKEWIPSASRRRPHAGSSATAATVSNCVATNSAARLGRSDAAAAGGVTPCTIGRTGWPIGTSGTPTPASSSAKSGGVHTHASAPSARNRTASPTIGPTSPRDPYVDNNTRISLLPFP